MDAPELPIQGCQEQTFNRLFAQYGPVVVVHEAWRLLGYRSKDALIRAIHRKALPLRLIRPAGRRESFVSTQELSGYLARLAGGEITK